MKQYIGNGDQTWSFKKRFLIGPIACPEKSVTNYRYTLRNIPEEQELSRYLLIGTLRPNVLVFVMADNQRDVFYRGLY
jgi:hypothetical protein